MNLETPPAPLARRERSIAIAVAAVCAASRFIALARSPWEWDEVLFILGMRDYDVTQHHPHPPGFPVYIALGRIVRLVAASDFHALQAVNLAAAMLVFPALFLFARELRLRFSSCVIAGALFAFFPNVWYFGGTAFSDVPSIVLVLFAVTFLFRGARSRNAYWAGTLLLALAIGIRPQNFLIGLFLGVYATLKRRPLEILTALLIGVVVTGAAFGGAVYATGSFDDYVRIVREHGDYIARVDSWRNPARPPMWRLSDRFFVKQYQSPPLSFIATLFVIVSIAGAIRSRSRPLLFNTLTFAPFAVLAWMMLDRYSISRFSIGYQPMFAIFAADGIRRSAEWMKTRWQSAPHEGVVAGALILGFIAFTLPALTAVRSGVAPSVLAARTVPHHVDPARDRLFVGHSMTKFVDMELPGFPYTRVIDDSAMPLTHHPRSWLLAEIKETKPEGLLFRRERGSLWNIARRQYFAVKLEPLRQLPRFVDGWYEAEVHDVDEWRWMGGHSTTILPPGDGTYLFRLHAFVPDDVSDRPEIAIGLNGATVDRFVATQSHVERDVHVTAAPGGAPNVLELSIGRTISPARAGTGDDERELGLRVRYLGWGPAP